MCERCSRNKSLLVQVLSDLNAANIPLLGEKIVRMVTPLLIHYRMRQPFGSYFRKEHVPNLLQGEIFLKPSFCLLYSNLIIWLNESGSRDSEIHLKNLYSS